MQQLMTHLLLTLEMFGQLQLGTIVWKGPDGESSASLLARDSAAQRHA